MTTSNRKTPVPYLAIGIVASLAMIAIAAVARVPNYRVTAPAILIAVLWGLYLLRRLLNLHPLRYALLASAMLLHMLGAFGFYQRSPLTFSYDILVHFYFALAIAIALYFALSANFPLLRIWHLNVLTFFFMMGLGALHEIMEYLTYLLLGEERGMLKPSTSYFFDTQRDLTNNLLGAATGLIVVAIYRTGSAGNHRTD